MNIELVQHCDSCGFPFKVQQPVAAGTPIGRHANAQGIVQGNPNIPCDGVVAEGYEKHNEDRSAFCSCSFCQFGKAVRQNQHNEARSAFCTCPACKAKLAAATFRY